MSFHVGQKVVCVKGGWIHMHDMSDFTGPATNEIVTVSQIQSHYTGTYLGFKEWERNNWGPYPTYNAKYFRPIDYSFGESVCEHLDKIIEPETVEICKQ